MRKILIFLGVILIGLTLTGCNGSETITIPQYGGVTINNESPEVDGALTTFYTAKNASVSVKIAVVNPSNAVISSVVINGYKYFSSRFSADSTNQLIKFDLSTGSVLGEIIYSVDEIIYEDGQLSKSVQVNSNNTFKIYNFKNTPTVARENYVVTNDSLQVDFIIGDVDNVIVDNTLVAELYSGEVKVDEVALTIGKSTATFTGLSSNRPYEVRIKASFDLDDSNGLNTNVLLNNATFVTFANAAPISTISNAFVSSNQVVFNVTYVDSKNITVPGSIEVGLYKNNILQETISIEGPVTGKHFDNLLSNQQYVIKVVSDYNLNDGAGNLVNSVLYTYPFTTPANTVPTPQITNLKTEENRVSFNILIDDKYGVIDPDSLIVMLYVEGMEPREVEIEEYKVDFQLYNLVSGLTFTVKIFADYDLNDGSPIRENQQIFSNSYVTTEKVAPTVSVSNVVAKQGYVILEGLSVSDANSTIQGLLVATLYENGLPVKIIQFDETKSELVFEYLIQYQQVYSVKIVGSYNLSDGTGLKSNIIFYKNVSVSGENPKAPVVEFNDVINNSVFIEVDVRVMDADETIVGNTVLVSLYESGMLIDSKIVPIGTTKVTFENLVLNTEYALIASADYDVNDTSGVVLGAELNSELISTPEVASPAKDDPTAILTNVTSTSNSIKFNALVVDDDNAIIGNLRAVLYNSGRITSFEVPLVIGNNINIVIPDVEFGVEYELRVVADYSYGDGTAMFVSESLGTETITTVALVIIENVSETEETITFRTSIDSSLDISDSDVLYIAVYDELDNLVGSVHTISSGTTLSLFNLWSDYDYRVVVTGSYNGVEGVVTSRTFHTAAKQVQAIQISNLVVESYSIAFNVNGVTLPDPSDVIRGNVMVSLFRDGILINTRSLTSGTNDVIFSANTMDGSDYVIQVKTTINLNDSYGDITDYILDSASFIFTDKNVNPEE